MFLGMNIILISCGVKHKPVPIYNINAVTSFSELKLSDLVKNIRVVLLETNDSVQLQENRSGGYRMAVTQEYILVLGDESIYQFDAFTGKFIRRLAMAGNGPQEYVWISSYNIDPVRNILYVTSAGKKSQLAINYKTGEFLPAVPVSTEKLGEISCILPDGAICVPNDSLMFCRVNPVTGVLAPLLDSPVLTAVRAHSRSEFIKWFGYNSTALQQDDYFLFNQKISDTLYKYTSLGDLEKVLAIYSDNIQDPQKGTTLKVRYVDNESILFISYNVGLVETNSVNLALLNAPAKTYCISRKNDSIQEIRKFIFDPFFCLEEEGEAAAKALSGQSYSNNNFYARALNAYKVKEAIELNLTEASLPADKVARLKELNARLDEYSNPVVIIGEKR